MTVIVVIVGCLDLSTHEPVPCLPTSVGEEQMQRQEPAESSAVRIRLHTISALFAKDMEPGASATEVAAELSGLPASLSVVKGVVRE